MENLKPAYSISELLEIHPGSRTAVYGEIAAGRLKAKKLGGRTIILASDYLAFLQSLPDMDAAPTEDAA